MAYVRRLGLLCEPVVITVKTTDEQGRYSLDYVAGDWECPGFTIRAEDTQTGEEGELTTSVRLDGERLRLDLVLTGRGSVEGTVRDEAGDPVPNAAVEVTSSSGDPQPAPTDQNGHYRIDGVVVGAFGVRAWSATGATGWATGSLTTSGAAVRADVTVLERPVVVLAGEVREPDGSVAFGLPVFIAEQDDGPGGASGGFFGREVTDEAGTFLFDELRPGTYKLRALNRAMGLLGEALITIGTENGPDNPAFVRITLSGTGSVTGTIYKRAGEALVPVPGPS